MRKLTVTIVPNFLMKRMIQPVFENISSIELKELIRMDYTQGIKIGVEEIKAKPGVDLPSKSIPKKFEIVDVLAKDKDTYLCLVKVKVPKAGLKLLSYFNFDLIYDLPTRMTLDKITYSVIGTEKNLKRFLHLITLLGKIEQVSYKQADYRWVGISSCLTQKQGIIVREAARLGYYSYPRKIETAELARKLGLSKTTLVEHLRKAENRIMERVVC